MSGNPGGRPRGSSQVSALARQYTSAAIAELVRIMRRGKYETTRVRAAEVLLDRAWGKPTVAVSAEVAVAQVDAGEVRRVLEAKLLAMVGALEPAALPEPGAGGARVGHGAGGEGLARKDGEASACNGEDF